MSDLEKGEVDPVWLRVIYCFLFYLVFWLSEFVLIGLAVVQLCHVVVAGEPQKDLRLFGSKMALFIRQLIDYLVWSSDEKPFPFSDWPDSDVKND